MIVQRDKAAFIFPGQGSYGVGMGRDLHDASAAAREVWNSVDSSLAGQFSEIVFRGSEDDLRPTEVQQPAIVATSVGALAAFNEVIGVNGSAVGSGYPIDVVAFAGHSVGIISALIAAGCTPVGEAIPLVRDRGLYMADAAQAKPGRMAAVLGLELAEVEKLVARIRNEIPGSYLSIANINAPGQVIVAGDLLAIDQIVGEGKAAGARRVVTLNVSGAFHTIAMLPARSAMNDRLVAVGIDPPVAPLISNIDASKLTNALSIRAELADHIVAPVQWLDGVRTIEELGVRHIVEFGHGSVLNGMLRRMLNTVELHNVTDWESACDVANRLTNG